MNSTEKERKKERKKERREGVFFPKKNYEIYTALESSNFIERDYL